MDQVVQKIVTNCKMMDFLEKVLEKAHYTPEDRELLWDILLKILDCMETDAAWNSLPIRDSSLLKAPIDGAVHEVVMTLGTGVDRLQDEMLSEGKITEAYMIEVLGSEILLLAYEAYNEWVREHTEYVVSRYYFLGTPDVDVEALPDLLKRSNLSVTCTKGYCMLPKKSVAFYAAMSLDPATKCEGICMGCGRKDCPNHMTGDKLSGNRVLDRPLTYGYARILGL